MQAGQRQGALSAADKVGVGVEGTVLRILASGGLPVPGAGGGVGDGHARKRAIGEADVDHGGVLGLKTAGGAGLHALDGNGLAQQVAEQVDVVHQVDQDRAGTLLAAPLDVEVLVVLIDHVVEARHGELAQLAGLDDLLGLVDEGVVATVLTHEHGHAGGLGLGGEGLGVLEVVGDRLFDQRHDVALHGLAGNAQMQVVGGGDDDGLGFDLVHHLGGIGVKRHAGGLGRGAGALKGVGDGDELGLGLLGDKADVVAAHGAGADDGNADGVELRHFDSLMVVAVECGKGAALAASSKTKRTSSCCRRPSCRR